MIFNAVASDLSVISPAAAPLAFELQLKDEAGFVEQVTGRSFQLTIADYHGVFLASAPGTAEADDSGPYLSFVLDDAADLALVAAALEPTYELAELLDGGLRDPLVSANLTIQQAVSGFVVADPTAPTAPDGPALRMEVSQ